MIITIKDHNELLRVNKNYSVVSKDSDTIVIDNFYENFEDLYNVANNISAPIWKTSADSRNFKDYYDCRPSINIPLTDSTQFNYINEIYNIISSNFEKDVVLYHVNKPLEFNYFKAIKKPKDGYQFYPHKDWAYTALIYIDKVNNGGTVIYEEDEISVDHSESSNIFVNVSNYNKKLIKSKSNRLLIFKSDKLHGGYIDNYDLFLNNWRMNQVVFFSRTPID